jgi:hypothetical protein
VIVRLVEQEGPDARRSLAVAGLDYGTAALAETLTCSTWQGIRTCTDAHGYVSHETQWQGRTNG